MLAAAAVAAQSAEPTPTPAATTERIFVTAGGIEHSQTDTVEPVSVLSDIALKQQAAPTLGDTLRDQPGVASSGFTAGASRPIIRGLADNRVRVLNNGTEVHDVSNLSPDHAPTIATLLSQTIEVVRGPATILYGSGAIGGVVNVLDNRIPVEAPSSPVSGEVAGRFGSADLERSGAVSVKVAATKNIVITADGMILRTDDRQIPGFALSEDVRSQLSAAQLRGRGFGENPEGEVPNTYVRTKDYGFGASYVWEKGYVGVSFSQLLSIYGVPGEPPAGNPVEPQMPVHLDLDKRQLNLRSSVVEPFPGFSTVNIKSSYTNYEHQEIAKDSVEATFKSSGTDSRLELVHQPIGAFKGSIGGQILTKDLSVLGDEAFLQPTETFQIAAFVFEEIKADPFHIHVGGRVEYDLAEIDSSDPELTSLTSRDQRERDFLPLSVAAGITRDFGKDYVLAVNATFSQRAPTVEELFARGPHEATFQFIIGDPDLDVETSRGIDVSFRKKAGVVTGSISGFYNYFTDFIAFTPTGDVEDGQPVFLYESKTAEFFGGEAQVQFHFLPQQLEEPAPAVAEDNKSLKAMITGEEVTARPNPNDFFLDLRADYVHAEDVDRDEPLPRITPFRYSASLNYQSPGWTAKIEGQRVNRQSRTAELETSTPGYTFLNASVGYKFPDRADIRERLPARDESARRGSAGSPFVSQGRPAAGGTQHRRGDADDVLNHNLARASRAALRAAAAPALVRTSSSTLPLRT